MKPREDLKMYTLRHFLFYMGVACLATTIVWAGSGALNWSNGLTFGALATAGLLVSLAALRESLFAPPSRSAAQRHSRRA